MKLTISSLLHRLFASRTVRVEKPTPWVLWDEDELRVDGMSEEEVLAMRDGLVRVPAPAQPVDEAALIEKVWHDTRPTPADQDIIDALRAAPLPEVTPEMRDRAIARFAEKFPNNPVVDPVATTEEFVAQVAGFRRAYLGAWVDPTDAQLQQVRDGLAADTEIAAPSVTPAPERLATLADVEPPLGAQLLAERRIVEQRSGRWPRLLQDQDVSRARPEPPQQSDYQPTTPPPAPLPRGTVSGPGFARTLERIDDVIAQEAAAKRYFDGLGDPA